ncbi:MAG: acylphosphatase [Gammaproteobacteria bacterium]
MDPAGRRFFISGRVQGVFFRASTVQQATRLGLRGWARNLADGRVEVLAAGPESALASLEVWLQEGPPDAQVSGVEATGVAATELAGLTDFRTG